MNGGIKFSFMGLVFCMQIWGLIMGEDSSEEVGVDHSLLCPPRSHDIFHKPCMDYCARAYRNNNGGACGQCVDYAERVNFVEKKCFCFLGLRCFPAVPFTKFD